MATGPGRSGPDPPRFETGRVLPSQDPNPLACQTPQPGPYPTRRVAGYPWVDGSQLLLLMSLGARNIYRVWRAGGSARGGGGWKWVWSVWGGGLERAREQVQRRCGARGGEGFGSADAFHESHKDLTKLTSHRASSARGGGGLEVGWNAVWRWCGSGLERGVEAACSWMGGGLERAVEEVFTKVARPLEGGGRPGSWSGSCRAVAGACRSAAASEISTCECWPGRYFPDFPNFPQKLSKIT